MASEQEAPRETAAPGWHPDPWGAAALRWWDGTEWTGHTTPLVTPAKPWFPQQNERDESQSMHGGGVALVGFCAAFAASLVVVVTLVLLDEPGGPLVTLSASAITLWAGDLIACVYAVRRYATGSLRDLGLARLTWRDFRVGLVAAIVARVGSIVAVLPILVLFPDEFDSTSSTFGAGLESGLDTALVLGAIAVIGAPFFEELFFRGLVQSTLTRRWGVRTAVCAQAGLFGLVHLLNPDLSVGQAAATFLAITFAGLVLGAARWRTGRLGPGMIAHALFAMIAILATL